jgi:GDP-D-mannose 3',5'-epimerase
MFMNSTHRRALVCGAGGFIGSHLVKRLKHEGFWVRGADIKLPEFSPSRADDFMVVDLRQPETCLQAVEGVTEVYQLAADMGGAGFIFTGDNDAAIMRDSALINLNIISASLTEQVPRIFYSSSACIYPAYNQEDPDNPNCAEESAYPAAPDSDYGWEKLFSERLYLAHQRNANLTVRIARFHNVFGPEGTWTGGKEKSPAALCRKVAAADDGGEIEIWGDGEQSRLFLYIDECVDGIRRLMDSDFTGPVNVGSDEMVTINKMLAIIMEIAGKRLSVRHIPGPLGVRGRNSDNRLIRTMLGWSPTQALELGLKTTYHWIAHQVAMTSRAKELQHVIHRQSAVVTSSTK